jgi:acyl carrier protein
VLLDRSVRAGGGRVQPFTIEELRQLLVDATGLPPGLTVDDPATLLTDLDVDSVGLLSLLGAVERRRGVRIAAVDALRMSTVGDAVDLVNELLGRAARA